jgi:penicillin amidase
MQMDRTSLPWREVRGDVLAAASQAGDLGLAVDLLRRWDGVLSPDSAAATLFETFLGVLTKRIAVAKAPNSSQWALGRGFWPLVPLSMFLIKRVSHTVRLLRARPEGWFDDGWDTAIRDALRTAYHDLVSAHGPDPAGWSWGEIRRLTLRHPLGARPPLDRVFNLGPLPHGGDGNTVNPAPVDPNDPTGNPDFAIASLRMVVDVGRWEHSRFVLPGGQSGNPFSRHYDDQLDMWRRGDAFPIAWDEAQVRRSARTTLVLDPAT